MTAPNSSMDELSKSPESDENNSTTQVHDVQDNESKSNEETSSDKPIVEVSEVTNNVDNNNEDDEEDEDDDDEDGDDDDKTEKLGDKNKQVAEKQSASNDVSSDYSKHLTYEGDLCIYTEPETGNKLVWNAQENKWIPKDKTENENNSEIMKNYEFDGNNYIYTDKTTNIAYKFDQDKNEWVVKDDTKKSEGNSGEDAKGADDQASTTSLSNNSVKSQTDNDIEYFWDSEKNAWFPKVDDDFMAIYQMNYGFVDPNTTKGAPTGTITKPTPPKVETKAEKEQKKQELKRKAAEPPTWFEIDDAHNTSVYISGLPLDISMDELVELVEKYGVIARDDKNKNKIKLYLDPEGNPKGDAVCTYIKIESVDLALKFLDGTRIRGKTLSAQRAKFQLKGTYDPSLKPKRKKKDKDRQKKKMEKILGWTPEPLPNQPLKCHRVVVLKNLFTPKDFEKDITLSLEYKQDIQSECAKCGDVTKVDVHELHPEGVAVVKFRQPEEADKCVQLMNGRWFNQRKIIAEIWDGKTKYKIKETEAEIEERLNKYGDELENS